PLVFISRKTLPFYSGQSNWFVLFSPMLWTVLASAFMLVATLKKVRDDKEWLRRHLPFLLLALGCAAAAFFGPDDFGLSNGSVLRERFFIFAFIAFIPIFRFDGSLWLRRATAACLAFVICFQTAALWDYALPTSKMAVEFMSARNAIPNKSSVASVIVNDDCLRFHSLPTTQIDNYF